MPAAVRAGLAYCALVFAAGFVLGVLRVGVVAPWLGALAAVALELPVALGVAWLACGRLVRRTGLPAAFGPRLVMGGTAFAVLILAEAALAVLVFGAPPAAFLASYRRPAGQLGLAGQLVFALLPLIRRQPAAALGARRAVAAALRLPARSRRSAAPRPAARARC